WWGKLAAFCVDPVLSCNNIIPWRGILRVRRGSELTILIFDTRVGLSAFPHGRGIHAADEIAIFCESTAVELHQHTCLPTWSWVGTAFDLVLTPVTYPGLRAKHA